MLSSPKAFIRFLSAELWLCVLRSHVLNLCIIARISASRTCPLASLLLFPITVASPISAIAREPGTPVLLLVVFSSILNAARSGLLMSCILSKITVPQLLQMISPDSVSVTILSPFLQIEHVTATTGSWVVIISSISGSLESRKISTCKIQTQPTALVCIFSNSNDCYYFVWSTMSCMVNVKGLTIYTNVAAAEVCVRDGSNKPRAILLLCLLVM